MLYVHYHGTTGEIANWGDGEMPAPFQDGHLVAKFRDRHMHNVHPSTHRIENGAIVEKRPTERAPKRFDVDCAIRHELAATDAFMVIDRPISDADRVGWKVYRQALRDLSKLPDAAAMVRAFPHRPDGADHAAHLRAALDQAL